MEQNLAETFVKMAGFRNVLVHMYARIDLKRVYQGLKQLSDFEAFAKSIAAWLQASN